ncbi:MAG: beta-N-acetylglucosaminidase domain-containing protein [Acidimicrobiales bacterium]
MPADPTTRPFGVIEGFYGDPWSLAERLACIDALASWGANTYVWAPKSEPRHRDSWDEAFTAAEIECFAAMAARDGRVRVSVGLTPGDGATVDLVVRKLAPALAVTDGAVTLCFDDLPALEAADHHRDIANGVAAATGRDVWLVPTHYAGTVGSPYLGRLHDGLDAAVTVMWTGQHVVTPAITAADVAARTAVCGGRAPLVWDNVPVNDAMMSGHLHISPFVGREPAAAGASAGWLLNPMLSMRASLPTIRSACAWWHGEDALAAWREEADAQGLMLLAQATAYPGDMHWPGDEPSTQWLESVAGMDDTGDPDLDPWVESARRGAVVALAARSVVAMYRAETGWAVRAVQGFGMVGLRDWLQLGARTLGAGPRSRPVFTQTADGRFAMEAASLELTESIPEREVRAALSAMSRAEDDRA